MASAGQPSPKAPHYTQQLHAVLLRGAWGESTPGRAPSTSTAGLSWPELLRKYRKHTSNDGTFTVLEQLIRKVVLIVCSFAITISLDGCGCFPLVDSVSNPAFWIAQTVNPKTLPRSHQPPRLYPYYSFQPLVPLQHQHPHPH